MLSEKSKSVTTPREMQNLKCKKPERKEIVKRSFSEIFSASLPHYFDPPVRQPQRAKIAYYTCQIDQVPAYNHSTNWSINYIDHFLS